MNVPGNAMTLRLNFWVPGPDFAAAYDPRLNPDRTRVENRTFFFEVDFVEVRALAGASDATSH
jgi:hypothetical protein